MATDTPRIDELRRRLQQDPASIAFAQLAEEHRRRGELDESVRVCRAGLAHHPGYVSAHVTLGRALMALGQHEEARVELEYVLRAAPDNLLALRSLEELREAGRDGPPDVLADDRRGQKDPPQAIVEELEGWLAAILADRRVRGVRL
jgi:tetratricopeptide (TPR) repeat protein